MKKNNSLLLVCTAIFVAAISRLMPHLPNFTPIIAMSLMAGSVINKKPIALLVVLLSMFVSDVLTIHFINYNFSTYSGYFFSISALSVYVTIAAIVLFGSYIKDFKPSVKLGATGILAGITFWTITNFALWLGGLMYATNATGLATCFTMALPFLQNQILGDLLFTLLFAGLFQLVQNSKVMQTQKL